MRSSRFSRRRSSVRTAVRYAWLDSSASVRARTYGGSFDVLLAMTLETKLASVPDRFTSRAENGIGVASSVGEPTVSARRDAFLAGEVERLGPELVICVGRVFELVPCNTI